MEYFGYEPGGSNPTGLWEVLKALAETGVIFAAFSFAVGWSYLAAYFNAFGFRPMELDVSPATAAVFTLTLVHRSVFVLLGLAAVATVLTVLMGHLRFRLRAPKALSLVLGLTVLLVILFLAGASFGARTAREDAHANSSRLLWAGFYVDIADKEDYPECVTKTLVNCKLLLRTKGNYYFFQPVVGDLSSPKQPFAITIYALPETRVQMAKFRRGFE